MSKWLDAAPARPVRAAHEEQLAAEIAEIHSSNRGAYGCPRITVELRRRGLQVNQPQTRRADHA
jgi:hypothetical protein